MRLVGKDRVAGFDADVVQLMPARCACASAIAIWSEKRSGLVIKLQTLDGDGQVVEQAAFSELQLDAPVKMHKLAQMMGSTAATRSRRPNCSAHHRRGRRLDAEDAGRGFQARELLPAHDRRRRPVERTVQWIFSDGLASVSLFLEPYDSTASMQQEVPAHHGRDPDTLASGV